MYSIDDSTIKDFDSMYVSEEIEVPPDFPALYSPEERIVHLSKVREVFSQSEGAVFLNAIRESPKCSSSAIFNGGKRDFYISGVLNYFKVVFDENGKINDQLIKNSKYTNQPLLIKKLMITLTMERLAQELKWKNTTQCLSCNAIDYHFTKYSEEPLDWHSDALGIPVLSAEHSFIVLLSNPDDENTGWTRGDFLYTAGRAIDCSKTAYEERKKYTL